jgi:hypothetical protein
MEIEEMIKISSLCIGLGMSLLAGSLAAQSGYTAHIDGTQQVPANASAATGNASLMLNAAGDTLTYSISLVGLDLDGTQTVDPNDDVTAVHLHVGAPGASGPIRFGIIGPGDDADDIVIDPVAGTITGAWEESDVLSFGGSLSSYVSELDGGQLYINIHSVGFAPGEVRGQVLRTPAFATEIPTLGGLGFAALALLLGFLGFFALRRRASH